MRIVVNFIPVSVTIPSGNHAKSTPEIFAKAMKEQ